MVAKGADEADEGGVQVVARIAAILRELGAGGGRSLAEIARAVGMPRTTVHRLVKALEQESFVTAAPAAGGYRLGPGVLTLAGAGHEWLINAIHPTLMALSEELAETVDLAVLRGDRVVFIDQVANLRRLQAVSAVGLAFPLHSTANGKAILATLTDERVGELLPSRLPCLTLHTITRRAELLADLAEVRRTGLGWDREENDVGICAVGAAIANPLGIATALSVPVPVSRFYGREDELAAATRRALADITAAIG